MFKVINHPAHLRTDQHLFRGNDVAFGFQHQVAGCGRLRYDRLWRRGARRAGGRRFRRRLSRPDGKAVTAGRGTDRQQQGSQQVGPTAAASRRRIWQSAGNARDCAAPRGRPSRWAWYSEQTRAVSSCRDSQGRQTVIRWTTIIRSTREHGYPSLLVLTLMVVPSSVTATMIWRLRSAFLKERALN